jgi:MarR family transcriptional regulator, organic hydroperoxide resistance regulator
VNAPPRLDRTLAFLRLLWALDHGLQRVSKRLEAERGVTGQQRLLLRVVARNPGISPGALAEALHLHPSTVTGLVQRLVRRGFVTRRPDPSDRRRFSLALTARARPAVAPGPRTVEALVAKALAIFPGAKLEAAEELLRSLANVLVRGIEE